MSDQKATVAVYDRQEKEARDYWISKLSSETGASNIILDYERPAVVSGERGCIFATVKGELFDRLEKLTSGSTFLLYAALLAGLEACLHKYTGNHSVTVGSPARKNGDGLSQPANALPIIVDIDGRMSFRELLLNVRAALLEAYANQSYPFQNLARDLGLGEIENRCPLFDIALVLTDIHTPMPNLRNDITITFTREVSQIACLVEFTREIFAPESIELFLGCYTGFLGRALEDTARTVDELWLIPESERHQLLVEYNASQTAYPDSSCIHHLFETQVGLRPEAIAVALNEEQITYKELGLRADKLARHLRSKGVGPEVIVAIFMDRSIQTIEALLAVLKSGGAFLPLDPAYPKERIAFMLEDAQASVILTQKHLSEALPENDLTVISVDSISTGEDQQRPVIEAAPGNAAYVIYTSGSTGRPKGVLIEHRGVNNLVQAQGREFDVRPDSRVLQFASLSFDASVSEVFVTLCGGATLVVAKQEELLPGPGLIRLLQEQAISIVTLPPSALMVLPDESLSGLLTLVVAGEACPPEVVARWAKGRRFLNAYGPTEATVCATIERCERDDGRRPAIGRPIDNVQNWSPSRSGCPERFTSAARALLADMCAAPI
jgi:amino acid adenylation domain-containing protein